VLKLDYKQAPLVAPLFRSALAHNEKTAMKKKRTMTAMKITRKKSTRKKEKTKTAMKKVMKTAMKKTKTAQGEKFQPGYLDDNIFVGAKGKVWRRYGCHWWQQ